MVYYRILNIAPCVIQYGEGNGTPLQYSCLENSMDGGAWWAAVHGVAKNRTWLSNFTFTFHFHALEKEMATSVLAWRIPGKGELGGLPSMGSYRVGHDWSDLAAVMLASWLHIMRTLVFSVSKSHLNSMLVPCHGILCILLNNTPPKLLRYL